MREGFYSYLGGNYIVDPEAQTDHLSVSHGFNIRAEPFMKMMEPRPCTYRSAHLKRAEYYLGDEEMVYGLKKENPGSNSLTLRTISEDAELFCLNGRDSVEEFAYFNTEEKTVNIETDKIDENRCKKTVIRECDSEQRLLELYLDIDILMPRFETYIKSYFEIPLGIDSKYRLPRVVD